MKILVFPFTGVCRRLEWKKSGRTALPSQAGMENFPALFSVWTLKNYIATVGGKSGESSHTAAFFSYPPRLDDVMKNTRSIMDQKFERWKIIYFSFFPHLLGLGSCLRILILDFLFSLDMKECGRAIEGGKTNPLSPPRRHGRVENF